VHVLVFSYVCAVHSLLKAYISAVGCEWEKTAAISASRGSPDNEASVT